MTDAALSPNSQGSGAPGLDSPARADQGPISRRAAILMVLVGAFAFSALVVLLSYAPDLHETDNGEPQALSKSAIGYAGIVELLKFENQSVVVSRTRLSAGHSVGLLIATPPPQVEKKDVQALGFGGPVLVVMPKWHAMPDRLHRGWVTDASLIDPKEFKAPALMAQPLERRKGVTRPVLSARAGPFDRANALTLGPVDQLQTVLPPGWIPILVDETGAAVLSRDPKSNIYLLSDPDLINTRGLKNADTALAASLMLPALKAGEGPVIFDVTLNGLARERSVLRLLFDPPFLAVTLCVFFAACLAGFQAACRFGAVRRAGRVFALGKEALADNTAALIRLARREHRMGSRYADLTRTIAAKAVAAPRDLTGDALTLFLDRMGRQRGAKDNLTELTTLAASAPDRERLAAVAQRLFRWRLEMTRERQ